MLQPTRRKYRKEQKGRNTGIATPPLAKTDSLGSSNADIHRRETMLCTLPRQPRQLTLFVR